MSYKSRCEELLAEHVEVGRRRALGALDTLRKDLPLVIYGAGNTGKKLIKALRAGHVQPLCVTDANANGAGSSIEGIPVTPLRDAVARYGENALFIVAVFNRELHCDYRKIKADLQGMGVRRVAHYSIVAWKYHEALLPHYAQGMPDHILPYAKSIQKAFSLFHDARSQELFVEMMRVSLLADYENFSEPDKGPEYWTHEILEDLPESVCMADCGAYTGDTLRSFLNKYGADRLKTWTAFEPDPENFKSLTSFVSELPQDLAQRIVCIQAGVGKSRGEAGFLCSGTESAQFNSISEFSTSIPIVCIDDVFSNSECNFIKMDIEGFEEEALIGAVKTIKNNNPLLAISVYHKPSSFYDIPNIVSDIVGNNYKDLFMRRCYSFFYDTVLYASSIK